MKNKDNSAWTQPKDPLMIKMEAFADLSNIYREDLYSHQILEIDSFFLSTSDKEFIKNYSDEHFETLIKDELKRGTDSSAFSNQSTIGRQLRMRVVDWLFEVINKFSITDRSIMFQTVELMDLYYDKCHPN
jgi:hypothetical protein